MGHHGQHQKVEKGQAQQQSEQKHKKVGHMEEGVAVAGALGAAAFAIHEHHQVKADPDHARRHRLEETIAGATALGTGLGVALHEYHKHNEKHLDGASPLAR